MWLEGTAPPSQVAPGGGDHDQLLVPTIEEVILDRPHLQGTMLEGMVRLVLSERAEQRKTLGSSLKSGTDLAIDRGVASGP